MIARWLCRLLRLCCRAGGDGVVDWLHEQRRASEQEVVRIRETGNPYLDRYREREDGQ